jgi:hypothetical protein
MRQHIFAALAVAAAGLLVAGCGGGDRAVRHDVAGEVRYAGQPVPAGTITFTPDASKQNTGAQGSAEIRDGKYDTRKGRGTGTPGGPVLVHIEMFDGKATADLPLGSPTYVADTKADLPRDDATKDFDIKPGDARKVTGGGGPPP